MNKMYFGMLFLIVSTVILLVLNHYGIIEKYGAFVLIPILAAYFIGQISERKYGNVDRKNN